MGFPAKPARIYTEIGENQMRLIEPWMWAGWAGVLTLVALLCLLLATSWVAIKKPPCGDILLLGLARVQTYLACTTAIMFIVNWPPFCGRLGSHAYTAIWMVMLSQILTTLITNFIAIMLAVGVVTIRYRSRLEPTVLDIVGCGSGIFAVAGNVAMINIINNAYTVQ
jgi:hypothetical protein